MTTAALAPGLPIVRLGSRAMRADPYPTYARLRAEAPLAPATAPLSGQMWLLTRYDDVAAALKDRRLSSAPASREGWRPELLRVLYDSMVLTDDPDHARLRGLVHLAFTPARVEALAGRVAEIVDELLGRMARQGRADLIADFALPLPLAVISEMMGVAPADRDRFGRWVAGFLEGASGGPLEIVAGLPKAARLLRFLKDLIARRRADPRDDLLSALIAAEQAGDRLSEAELLSMVFLLLLAGHETTVNLIGNGAHALLSWPEQYARLGAEPGLAGSAVEELLRYTNPVEHGAVRRALEDIELHGRRLPRGSQVVAVLASANRDERAFDQPDTLDLARSPNRHLAFSLGLHYCLGAPLARLEGAAALGALAERFPGLALAAPPEALRWRGTIGMRGLRRLPVLVKR